MKKILQLIFLALTLSLGHSVAAQNFPLSESAYAELLTCEPSNELYTSFSHSALHICDTARLIDIVYNYGTFDFETPHFVWKFATRTLDYCISKDSYLSFINEYTYYKRAVWAQRLKLSHQELCNLYLALEFNYQPEYRWYRYDFFRDNCATRIRDIITNSLNHRSLDYPTDDKTGKTYRDIVYTTNHTYRLWWRLAIDIALGARCDKNISTYECAFLPLEMMTQFDTLKISGSSETLTHPAVKLLEDHREPLHKSISPDLCFWLLFVVVSVLSFFGHRKKWNLIWMDSILFGLAGLASLIVMFLWFASAHYCCKWNLNLLWASPLFIYFAIFPKRSHHIVAIIQAGMLIAVMGMIATGWPQHFNTAILPITLTLFVRLIGKMHKREKEGVLKYRWHRH